MRKRFSFDRLTGERFLEFKRGNDLDWERSSYCVIPWTSSKYGSSNSIKGGVYRTTNRPVGNWAVLKNYELVTVFSSKIDAEAYIRLMISQEGY